jgi:hypothetical protein
MDALDPGLRYQALSVTGYDLPAMPAIPPAFGRRAPLAGTPPFHLYEILLHVPAATLVVAPGALQSRVLSPRS